MCLSPNGTTVHTLVMEIEMSYTLFLMSHHYVTSFQSYSHACKLTSTWCCRNIKKISVEVREI